MKSKEQVSLINNTVEIGIDYLCQDFSQHLNLNGNSKIIVSGKYGTGKSYFLNQFFSNEKFGRSSYNAITISPVNYVVNSNEDIFELIKVDILLALFSNKDLDFIDGDYKFDTITTLREFFKDEKFSVGKEIVKSLIKIKATSVGQDVELGIGLKLLAQFRDYEKRLNSKHKPSGNIAKEHVEEWIEKIGTYLEYNFITEIISDSLLNKKKKSKKENVLIIEDFDRLDPAHIFRIMNIFSTHTINDSTNKFGFDKVIIVCDLGNIESLYRHMYGSKIDFKGYLDKFFSYRPFYFDNKKTIYTSLHKSFGEILDENSVKTLSFILNYLIKDGHLSLRAFLKGYLYKLPMNEVIIDYDFRNNKNDPAYPFFNVPQIETSVTKLSIFLKDVPLVLIVDFLSNILGGRSKFFEIIDSYSRPSEVLGGSLMNPIIFTLAIPHRILSLKNSGELQGLFYQSNKNFAYPDYELGNLSFTHKHYWNSGRKYNGDQSYFHNAVFFNHEEKAARINSETIFSIIKEFALHAEERNWLKLN